MSWSTVESESVKVVFFSRGRGRGHVVPDMSLVKELQNLDSGIVVHWVSYGTGAAVLREAGYAHIDLGLPDDNAFLETQMRAIRVLAALRPHVVVAHEEFAAVPAARIFGVPALFVTDYFLHPSHLWMQCLAYSEEIIFIDREGIFDVPEPLNRKVFYTGPFVRKLNYSCLDRERARAELAIESNTKLLLVLPGSWFTEARAPIFDLVVEAYRRLPWTDKQLIWVAGEDYHLLRERTACVPGMTVLPNDPQIDRWMAASDLAITKATRKTSLELAAMGIPAISLSHGLNRIDDQRVSHIPSHLHLIVSQIDAEALAEHFIQRLNSRNNLHPDGAALDGLPSAAGRLAEQIRNLKSRKAVVKPVASPTQCGPVV